MHHVAIQVCLQHMPISSPSRRHNLLLHLHIRDYIVLALKVSAHFPLSVHFYYVFCDLIWGVPQILFDLLRHSHHIVDMGSLTGVDVCQVLILSLDSFTIHVQFLNLDSLMFGVKNEALQVVLDYMREIWRIWQVVTVCKLIRAVQVRYVRVRTE